jgi:hypothetical protein
MTPDFTQGHLPRHSIPVLSGFSAPNVVGKPNIEVYNIFLSEGIDDPVIDPRERQT